MSKHNINMNFSKKGGFVQSMPGALMSVLRAIVNVFKFVFKLIIFIIRTLGPYVIKFLVLCVGISVLLTLFGFFGIFFTFCAIFLIYYKLFKKIKAGNLKFAAELNKKASDQSPQNNSSQSSQYKSPQNNFSANLPGLAKKATNQV